MSLDPSKFRFTFSNIKRSNNDLFVVEFNKNILKIRKIEEIDQKIIENIILTILRKKPEVGKNEYYFIENYISFLVSKELLNPESTIIKSEKLQIVRALEKENSLLKRE